MRRNNQAITRMCEGQPLNVSILSTKTRHEPSDTIQGYSQVYLVVRESLGGKKVELRKLVKLA